MAIRKRFSKPKPLEYLLQFGSIENPPLKPSKPERLAWCKPYVETVRPVFSDKKKDPIRRAGFPKNMWGRDPLHAAIVCGLVYCHHKGCGPGQGYSIWVNQSMTWFEQKPITTFITGSVLKGKAPVYKYLGWLAPKNPIDEDAPFRGAEDMRLWDKAYERVLAAYEKIHDVSFDV